MGRRNGLIPLEPSSTSFLRALRYDHPRLLFSVCAHCPWQHYLSIPEWKKAYPEAQVIGPKGVDEKLPDIKFDYLFTEAELDKTFGDNEIQTHSFPGYFHAEIGFLHVPSKTFLNADLAENLPATEQFSTSGVDATGGFLTWVFIKMFSPHNWFHNFLLLHGFTKDKT